MVLPRRPDRTGRGRQRCGSAAVGFRAAVGNPVVQPDVSCPAGAEIGRARVSFRTGTFRRANGFDRGKCRLSALGLSLRAELAVEAGCSPRQALTASRPCSPEAVLRGGAGRLFVGEERGVGGVCDSFPRTEQNEHVVVPPRYTRVDPWVISRDTDAEIAFLQDVFGAQETPGSRMAGPAGRIGHVEVEIGDAVIMMFDAGPDWPATPAHLRVYVADVHGAVDCATAAGARIVTAPTELAFGERVARVRDPQGHLWWVHERVEEVAAAELASRFAVPAAQEALAYVQQSLANELSHAR